MDLKEEEEKTEVRSENRDAKGVVCWLGLSLEHFHSKQSSKDKRTKAGNIIWLVLIYTPYVSPYKVNAAVLSSGPVIACCGTTCHSSGATESFLANYSPLEM